MKLDELFEELNLPKEKESKMIQLEKLKEFEYEMAVNVGMRRHVSSVYKNDRDVAGYNSDSDDAYKDAVEAAPAELAVAKYYGIYWDGSYNTYGIPDLLDGTIDVKRCRANVHLIVRPKDEKKPDCALIAVTGSKGSYVIHGWQMRSWIIQNVQPSYSGLDKSRPPARITSELRSARELNDFVLEHLRKKYSK